MFDLDAFVHSPSLDELESFKKSDIIVICKHYQLECKASMVKSTLVKLIAQHLVDEQIGGEDFQNLIDSGDQDRFVKLKELENKSKELEIKKNEVEIKTIKHDYYQNNRDSNRNFLHQRDSVDYKPSNTPANYRPEECSNCYKKVTMNTNVTKSCINKTHINLTLYNAQPYKRDVMIQ